MENMYTKYLLSRVENIFRSYNYKGYNISHTPILVNIDRNFIPDNCKADLIKVLKSIANKFGVSSKDVFVRIPNEGRCNIFINIKTKKDRARTRYNIIETDFDFGFNPVRDYQPKMQLEYNEN